MKRKEFNHLVLPLTDKLFRIAYNLIPDDLQAEQLVVDGFNAYLLKEKKNILLKNVDFSNRKETGALRRMYFKGILRYIGDIGIRRSSQLIEQLKLTIPAEYRPFYSLDAKVRLVMCLRFDAKLSVEDIEEVLLMARYAVIEKIHNGRFLLINDLNKGVPA